MLQFQNTVQEMYKMIKNKIVPGISYAIIDHHHIIKNQIGKKQVFPYSTDLLPNQIYDLASLTKVVGTVPVILQLIENNQLKLDDSISMYLPKWKYPKVTVRNLLTHTSGIEGYIPHRNQLPPKQLISSLLNLKIGKNFNRKMVYTDTNFIFLGLIAAKILKRPIQNLIQERVLKPLHMNDSSFSPNNYKRCVPTELIHNKLLQGIVDDPKARILKENCGSAGLFSNIDDLIKFCNSILYPNNYPNILSLDMIKTLFHDQTPNHKLNRSFGWSIRHYPHFYIYQSGYTGTGIALKPQDHRALIFLSNRIHPKGPNIPFLDYRRQVVETFINEK